MTSLTNQRQFIFRILPLFVLICIHGGFGSTSAVIDDTMKLFGSDKPVNQDRA